MCRVAAFGVQDINQSSINQSINQSSINQSINQSKKVGEGSGGKREGSRVVREASRSCGYLDFFRVLGLLSGVGTSFGCWDFFRVFRLIPFLDCHVANVSPLLSARVTRL